MHCSVIEHGYDVIEFSNCSTEERGIIAGMPNSKFRCIIGGFVGS